MVFKVSLSIALLIANAAATENPFTHLINPEDFHYCGLTVPMQTNPLTAIPRLDAHMHPNFTLLQVQALIRHGAPIESTDSQCACLKGVQWNCTQTVEDKPNLDSKGHQRVKRLYNNVYDLSAANGNPGTCEAGQLLDVGVIQHTNTGKSLHAAYVDETVPRAHRISEVNAWLYSDNCDRTTASGKILYSNMFPTESSMNTKITKWRQADKSLFDAPDWCTTKECLKNTLPATQGWYNISWAPNPQRIVRWCWWQAGCNHIKIDVDVQTVIDATDAANDEAVNFLKKPMEGSFVPNGAIIVPQLVNLINHNLELANNAANKAQTRQFVLWASHDLTVMSYMSFLQIPAPHWVPFATVFLIELWKDASMNKFVRIIFNGVPQKLPFCTGSSDPMLCPYEQFNDFHIKSIAAMKEMGMDLPVF